MLGCNRMAGLGQYYTAGGYYYDAATGKAVYTQPAATGLTAAQQTLIAQSEKPVYTANSTQLASQQNLVTQSEQPAGAGASSGGGTSGGGVATSGGTRAPGVPLLSFGPTSGTPFRSAAGLTATQQAIAAGYTPTQWAALTPAQQSAALKAAGYGSGSVGPAGASFLNNPTMLLVLAVVVIAVASGSHK